MIYSGMICLLLQCVFDYTPGDVFGCVADIGWITGHSYVVYGPLCNGATSVLFESTPVYPNPGEYQEKLSILMIHIYNAHTLSLFQFWFSGLST